MKLIKGLLVFFLILTIIITIVSGTQGKETSGSAPLINSSLEPLTVSCDYTREDLLEGLTAYDTEDGYITDSIIPGEPSVFTEKGVSKIEYYVYDSDNKCGRYKREVAFNDYSSPTVGLSSPLVFYVRDASNGDIVYRLYGRDRLDGDVKHILIDSSDIDYDKAGDYVTSVSLTNSFGDTATYELPVHIIKKTFSGMEIRLNENLIYIKSDTQFDPEVYVKEVEFSQTEELVPQRDWGIDIESNVDTSEAGIYEVRYMIQKNKDEVYGNASGVTWLTVIVTD